MKPSHIVCFIRKCLFGFLKYRHKAETEIVKLIYKEEVVPEVTETTETTSTSETSPETTNSGETPAV